LSTNKRKKKKKEKKKKKKNKKKKKSIGCITGCPVRAVGEGTKGGRDWIGQGLNFVRHHTYRVLAFHIPEKGDGERAPVIAWRPH